MNRARAAAAVVVLICAIAGCSRPTRVLPGPTTTVTTVISSPPARQSSAALSLTAAQRAAADRWLRSSGTAHVRPIEQQEKAVLAALRAHSVYTAFDHCQPEQDAIEAAQSARPIPVPAADQRYQAVLSLLATATTHCLNGAGHGDKHDFALAQRLGAAGLSRLKALVRKL